MALQQQPSNDDELESLHLMSITDEEFNSIRTLVYDRFGINLTEQKKSLVVGRLQKLVRTLNLSSFSEYVKYLREDKTEKSLVELVNRISTNHTFFFREKAHFDFFVQRALPEAMERQKKKGGHDLRIWSAGCSSGEEPYTLMMLMKEQMGIEYAQWDAGVLATDVSDRVLSIAQEGIYSDDRLNLVPAEYKKKYFRKLETGEWQISDALKSEVTFRHFNLMNERFPFKKPFDAIFCRNVMIYFDGPTREALVRRFYESTAPGGYLFVGHSESLHRDSCPYEYVCPAVYRRRPG